MTLCIRLAFILTTLMSFLPVSRADYFPICDDSRSLGDYRRHPVSDALAGPSGTLVGLFVVGAGGDPQGYRGELSREFRGDAVCGGEPEEIPNPCARPWARGSGRAGFHAGVPGGFLSRGQGNYQKGASGGDEPPGAGPTDADAAPDSSLGRCPQNHFEGSR